mgnify:CR=1 FL=1
MWVKTSDDTPNHPRVLNAGIAAYGLWHAGLAFANRHMTDGYLPKDLTLVFAKEKKSYLARLADRLVEVGLWAVVDPSTGIVPGVTGIPAYLIQRYSECQPMATRNAQIQKKSSDRLRQQRYREKTDHDDELSRRDNGVVTTPRPDQTRPDHTTTVDGYSETADRGPSSIRSFAVRFFAESYERKRNNAWMQGGYFSPDFDKIAKMCASESDAETAIKNYFAMGDEYVQREDYSPRILARNWNKYRNPPAVHKARRNAPSPHEDFGKEGEEVSF